MPASVQPPLVGRERALEAVSDALAVAEGGGSTVLLVEGEPGIGKTRLLGAAADMAAGRRFTVLTTAAFELEHMRPFGTLIEAVGTIDDEALRPFREEVDVATASEPQLIDHLVDGLERLAARRPVVLVLDDLQWADLSTVLALRTAVRRLRWSPILFLCGLRPPPWSPQLRRAVDLLIEGGAVRLPLEPLAAPAVAKLVTSCVGARPGPGLLAKVDGARGNPFFIVELTKALVDEAALTIRHGTAEVADRATPPRVHSAVLRRLGFLPPATLTTLRHASLLGRAFSVADVAAANQMTVASTADVLGAALESGFVVPVGDHLAFGHDLVREALYETWPAPVRKGLHRATGELLVSTGASLTRIATQFALGAEVGDETALTWIRAAMDEARLRSVSVAAELARLGFDLSIRGSARQEDFAVWLTSILYWSGAMAEAESFARSVVSASTGSARAKIRFMLGAALEAQGRLREADEEFALVVAEPAIDRQRDGGLVADVAFRLARQGHLERAEELIADVPAGSDASGLWLALGEMTRCQIAGARGQVEAAVSSGNRAVTASAAHWVGSQWGFPFAWVTLGWALVDADELDEAIDTLGVGRREAELRGVLAHLPLYHGALALIGCLGGRFDDALVEADAGLDLLDELGMRRAAAQLHAARTMALLSKGELVGAAASALTGERDLAGREPEFGADWLAWSVAQVREAEGDDRAALEALVVAWRTSATMPYFAIWRSIAPPLVRLALAAGDRTLPVEVTDHAVEGARRARGIATAEGAALRCRALVDRDPALALAAVDAYRHGGRPMDLAGAYEDSAFLLESAGRRDEAATALRAALEVYDRLGLPGHMSRITAELRARGVRVGRPTRAPRPKTGWDSLTSAEATIVGLVAEGLSNPEIAERLYISRRTVQAHLSHVFRKLDLGSRTQLSAEAVRRQESG